MLLVKTIVLPSPIANIGLFADEDIKEGQIVWQYDSKTCITLTEHQIDSFLKSFQKTNENMIHPFLEYGYYAKDLDSIIVCFDNGRYVNHAKSPNLTSNDWKMAQALRDIKKGEELTQRYDLYDSSAWFENLHQKFNIWLPRYV